jgi:ABC-type cobalamin/Fe3+-siderophores transport system ATPase subunit
MDADVVSIGAYSLRIWHKRAFFFGLISKCSSIDIIGHVSIDLIMMLLTAKNLHLSLGKKHVINAVDIEIQANECVGLIGPNGAGKSSLLRLLAGLIAPLQGEVRLHLHQQASEIHLIPPRERARFIGYLTQHETPAWPLSVKSLVELGRIPWNGNLDDNHAIAKALQITDVNGLEDRPITELSGGELRRVLLARVFAGDPQVIIADEPIASLDLYHQLQVMELLHKRAKTGGAVIAALHDLSLAARFCSRLVLIHHGRILASGTPLQVLTPDNLEKVYGINAYIDCREEGVVIIPRSRVTGYKGHTL